MKEEQFIRVVALRKGKWKPSEFKLRSGERGLSIFACGDRSMAQVIVEAVRAAGKTGDLAAVTITRDDLRALGLTVVPAAGQTPDPEANAAHREARLPTWRRILLGLRGQALYDYFNEQVSDKLSARAQILD